MEVAVPLLETRSSQPVPPQAFQPSEELRLHPCVRSLAEELRDRWGGDRLVSEFAGPHGRADFLLVAHRSAHFSARLAFGLPALRTESEAHVVASLSSRYARSPDDIAERSGLTPRSAARTATLLVRSGHLDRTFDGRFIRHAALRPVVDTVAFEAKLDDWRRAFRQARQYSLWNRRSIVVLERLTNEGALVDSARRFGIGVAECERLLVPPRVQTMFPHLELLASELYLAAVGELPDS